MSNSVFQSVIVQLREVSDRTFGVIDTDGCVVSCTDMSLLGERWADAALKVAELLRLGSYCRIDFILSDGVPYCLEANTLPGMTPTSLLPQMAAAVGLDYVALCEEIVRLALNK